MIRDIRDTSDTEVGTKTKTKTGALRRDEVKDCRLKSG